MKILIYNPLPLGGIVEHTHYQARELYRLMCEGEDLQVTVLCPADYLDGRKIEYETAKVFISPLPTPKHAVGGMRKVLRTMHHLWRMVANPWILAWEVLRRRPDAVLISCYSEYLAPLWVWPHWLLAKVGRVVYVANLHDPVRDYQVGPRWWHELCTRMAYWPISIGMVHNRLPEPSPVPSTVKVVEVAVGVYEFSEEPESPAAIRAAWGVRNEKSEMLKLGKAESRNSADGGNALDSGRPTLDSSAPADFVFLAFGFIRDNKNLDLAIRALADCPRAWLVVMGRAQSRKDKPVEFYRNLAEELGVQERVKFFDGFVPDERLGSYFTATDAVLLTYDKTFHSQSGVLNIAARARRPVLASSGDSPLRDSVLKYRTGIFVEPDHLEDLKEGMKKMIRGEWRVANGGPDWEGYEAYASWRTNVTRILNAARAVRMLRRKR